MASFGDIGGAFAGLYTAKVGIGILNRSAKRTKSQFRRRGPTLYKKRISTRRR